MVLFLRCARWSRFGLRSMLIAMALVCAALAVWRARFYERVEVDIAECMFGATPAEVWAFKQKLAAMREECWFYHDIRGRHVKHGADTLWNQHGLKIRERHWKHGQLDGLETNWDYQGQKVSEANYRDGEAHGWARFDGGGPPSRYLFDRNNLVWSEITLDDGSREVTGFSEGAIKHTLRWLPSGSLIREYDIGQDRILHGIDNGWYPDGTRSYEGGWHEGREHGRWTWWDDQGNQTGEVDFKDGVPQWRDQLSA